VGTEAFDIVESNLELAHMPRGDSAALSAPPLREFDPLTRD
jgi:hypothetical protein